MMPGDCAPKLRLHVLGLIVNRSPTICFHGFLPEVKNFRAILLSVVTVANASAVAVTHEVGWPVINFFEPSVSLPSSVLDLRLIVLRGTHNMPFSKSLTLLKTRMDKNRLGPVGHFKLFALLLLALLAAALRYAA